MKTLIAVLFLAVPVLGCAPGTIAYEGVCAADPRPAVVAVDYVKPSDEQVPKKQDAVLAA